MKRVGLCTLVLAIAFTVTASLASAQPAPEFKLGFKALADQIPDIVGVPLENEHWGWNGDSLQQTSTGLMVWRKADNWTAFTNGSRTWINGPYGVQDRGNDDRFEWEAAVLPEPSGFVHQPSYAGDCRSRPVGSVCVAYDDGYIWLVNDVILGWGDAGDWGGKKKTLARGQFAEYLHILGTDLVQRVDKPSPVPLSPTQTAIPTPPPDRTPPSVPLLLAPAAGAVLGQGNVPGCQCTLPDRIRGGQDWTFSWAKSVDSESGVEAYHIRVWHTGAAIALVDSVTSETSYRYANCGVVVGVNLASWNWQVRVRDKAGNWSDWSELRGFSVQQLPGLSGVSGWTNCP